jgi:hypothetical protein
MQVVAVVVHQTVLEKPQVVLEVMVVAVLVQAEMVLLEPLIAEAVAVEVMEPLLEVTVVQELLSLDT